MKTVQPARRQVSPLPVRIVQVAPALQGQGNISAFWHRGRIMKVDHIALPPDGPLTDVRPRCRAVVRKNRWSQWHWKCACGAGTKRHGSWQQAYRWAYTHVRQALLRETIEALRREELENDCGD